MSNSDRLLEVLAPVFTDETVPLGTATIDRMFDALRPVAAPEFSGVMVGQGTVTRSFDDVEGLREMWHEWLDVFARVRFELEGLEEIGENVVLFVNQIGTTRHGVDVQQPSAAVWKFRDRLLTRVEFHLDRQAALASANEPAES
jgi:hypothetical protein